jgi:hypothetical protein
MNLVEAIKPYVRHGELEFQPEHFVAMTNEVETARAEAVDLEAIQRLRDKGWSFGVDGNQAVEEEFLPYAPKDNVAVIPFVGRPHIACDLRLPHLNYEPLHTSLYAVSMVLTRWIDMVI